VTTEKQKPNNRKKGYTTSATRQVRQRWFLLCKQGVAKGFVKTRNWKK